MKIASNIEQYFDDEGRPLVNGRVSFYTHDSDTLADVYYMVGTNYVEAPNPLTTSDDGRVPTIFFEACVLDVKVEKKLPDGSYELMDTFQLGFDYPKAANETLAYGIEGLQNTDPAVGIVQVVGYYSEYDAPARWFVWDPNCTLAADGGIIIESAVGESGRWILLWDDELLPSSVYGILPGENESNLAAFLGYPDYIGTYMIRTPPMPRFMSGTYRSTNNFATSKTLYFDKGAQFTNSFIACASAVIPDNSSYVADMSFSADNAVAHSSWFKTAQAFWHCGANTFVIDYTNYMTSYALTTAANLSNVVIEGAHRLPTTYVNNAYLRLTNCSINGSELFSARYDRIMFYSMVFHQDWFVPVGVNYWDFGRITDGHNIELMAGSANNTIRFQNFYTPDVYLRACLANGDTSFDGHGATYVYSNNSQFRDISNCVFRNGFSDSNCDTWHNVVFQDGVAFSGNSRRLEFVGCTLRLDGPTSTITSVSLEDCTVLYGATSWCPNDMTISVVGGTFSGHLELSAAAKSAYTRNKSIIFDGCNVMASSMWINDITMRNCVCASHIYLVPYYEGEQFKSHCDFSGNRFIGNFVIEMKPKDMSTEADVHNVMMDVKFKDNQFRQTDTNGIVMPYLTNGLDRNKPYVALGSASLYINNTGNCPQEHMTPIFLSREMTESLSWGASSVHYMPKVWSRRVWNLNPNAFYTVGYGWQCSPDFSESWNIYTGRDAAMHEGQALHLGYVDLSDAGNDQFEVVHAWQHNDDWSDNKFVVMPVLDYGH